MCNFVSMYFIISFIVHHSTLQVPNKVLFIENKWVSVVIITINIRHVRFFKMDCTTGMLRYIVVR